MNIFIVGKSGMLAQELQLAFKGDPSFTAVGKGRPEIDLEKPETIVTCLKRESPSLVINAAAYTAVDRAESEPSLAFAVNRDGVRVLAEHCHRLGVPLIHVSTDYVFDGTGTRPYREDDPAAPLGVYGRSKWEGEEAIRRNQPKHIILRTAWLYSAFGRNFLKTILRKAREGEPLRIVNDQTGCPTWAKDVAMAIVAMARAIIGSNHHAWGTYHFCSRGQTTWYEFARMVIEKAQHCSFLSRGGLLEPISSEEFSTSGIRPSYSVLDCSKIQRVYGLMPPLWAERVLPCIKELVACPSLLHDPS